MNAEKREQIIDNLICKWGRDYLRDNYYEDEPTPMCEFRLVVGKDVMNALQLAYRGGRYGCENDKFNPNDPYFVWGTNLRSIPDVDRYLLDMITDRNHFVEWAKENGYADELEEENDEE